MKRSCTAAVATILIVACADGAIAPPPPVGQADPLGASAETMEMAMFDDPGAFMVEYAEELVRRYPAPATPDALRATVAPESRSLTAESGQLAALVVDDDGVQCPGAIPTIQAAVAAASAGATISVCPGTYYHTVEVAGPAKNGLRIIADNERGPVILQGPLPTARTEENGFFLRDVSGVTIRGFIVRGFGRIPTTITMGGVGNDILLLRANGNTISQNVLTASDMMGIFLVDSGNNLVEHNATMDIDRHGTGCGIMLAGTTNGKLLTGNNVFRHNGSSGNPLAGIMIRNASTGLVIASNGLDRGGRYGLQVWDTPEVRIERNSMNDNRGQFSFPSLSQFSWGLDLRRSPGAMVLSNVAFRNGATTDSFDFVWDGVGAVIFSDNHCGRSSPAGLCAHASP